MKSLYACIEINKKNNETEDGVTEKIQYYKTKDELYGIEVVKENNFPLEVEHSSLDGVPGFQGDMIITLPDVANELIEKNLPQKIVGIANIVDKNEIKIKLEEAFIELEKQ